MSDEKSVRLLLVEDNVADVLLMREALRELCSIPVEVLNVPDGGDALSLLERGNAHFDLVILDVSLPKMDGFSVLEQYQSSYPPVVVFSSSWDLDDSERALALGAKEFVSKPSTYDAYVEAVCGFVETWCASREKTAHAS
jgi:two-component system, chemotaxis family, response regulator Rcp1